MRRQRRPATMVALAAPNHPRRPPSTVRQPNPAAPRVHLPAAIMERRPAPGIIRLPKPSGVSPHPMAGIAIRPPGTIDHDDPRLPAPADAVQLNPGSVWRKVVIKVSGISRRTAHIHGRR